VDSIALTSNWLDAVSRARSASWQKYVQQVPQAKPSRQDRNLRDTIEAALHDAGVKPIEPAGATTGVVATGDAKTGTPPNQHIDMIV
jgi:hypothetical protein